MKKRLISLLLIAIMIVGCSATVSFGASGTKKMTVYRAIKSGNYVYCSARKGLYKVNVKTGKVKRLVKNEEVFSVPEGLKLHKGYIYYTSGDAITACLYRIKTTGKNKKYLGNVIYYAISNGKIYYTTLNDRTEKTVKRQMNLNGKGKKKSKYKVNMRYKDSNKSSYYVWSCKDGEDAYYDSYGNLVVDEYYTDYLIRPNGKDIKLCSYTDNHIE